MTIKVFLLLIAATFGGAAPVSQNDDPIPQSPPEETSETQVKPQLQLNRRWKEATEGSKQEVEFMCEDISNHGARVRWNREDGKDLPLGSTDIDGELTIPDVRAEYSGNYVCEAFELPANTPGRNITAMLIVKKKVGEPLMLYAHPSEKNVLLKEKAQFRCRDDGQRGARVRWSREDGADLPPGSITNNEGELIIHNVRAEYGGKYVCEAFEVPANTPGRQKIVTLNVIEKECASNQFGCSSGSNMNSPLITYSGFFLTCILIVFVVICLWQGWANCVHPAQCALRRCISYTPEAITRLVTEPQRINPQ